MRRLAGPLALLAIAAVLPTPAGAAEVAADRAVKRSCQARLLPAGTPGAARTGYTPAATGVLTTRLTGSSGDWDLALFDAASGSPRAASASAGRREIATALVEAGHPLVVQACRRSGRGTRATISSDLHEQAAVPSEPAAMVRVPLGAGGTIDQLEATGLDVTHDISPTGATVVLYSAAERAKLLAAGFTFQTLVPDLRAQDRARAHTDSIYSARVTASSLPSGRDSYRTLADYSTDLKSLADSHPSLVRRLDIGMSIEGRPIEGVEIGGAVHGHDGRPVFAVLGLHHAREWPSGEMPMEFAEEIAAGYGRDARITSLLDRVRVIVLPVMNPDGFNVSRTAGPTAVDDDPNSTLPLIVSDGASYKRKNCRPSAGPSSAPCISRPAAQGVDLNRNYGAYWGGPGSDGANVSAQDYRGPAPYSEPESEAFHKLSSTRSIVTVVTHHTFTDQGYWLRQPGFCRAATCDRNVDVIPDEPGMRALGDAMGHATGWASDLGWVIGQITGATEDWNYFAQGAYGYTPEQRGPNFHPNFGDAVVKEYTGTAPGAHGGVREALLRAGEQAANPSFHSVLLGAAPAGSVLRLRKSFVTDTSQPDVKVQDRLDFTTTVPDSGFYNWHVNQSTRPLSTTPESYALTCETPTGEVKETRPVTIARGEMQAIDLACGGPAPEPPTPTPPSQPGQLLCADLRAPVSSPTRGSLHVSRDRLTVRGRASDHGCRAAGGLHSRRGRLARVLVAAALRDGKRCRFLSATGGLSGPRSCSRALRVPAAGLTSWSLEVQGKLRRGRYDVWAQSVDTSGNVERRRRRVLSATLR